MNEQHGFALWLTGLPASGKSSIAGELVKRLRERSTPVVVLESDAMRKILTPEPGYSPEERDRFYRQLALLGSLITENGVNVILDATAHKRAYRGLARERIPKFLEVYVACPLEVCIKRDPKGIYSGALRQQAGTVPGLQAPYEPPPAPELTLNGEDPPAASANRILDKLSQFLYL